MKQTFIDSINKWMNRKYDNTQISQWIKFAEERISEELRIADMMDIDVGILTNRRVLLPSDWKELDFVHYENGRSLEFKSRTEFYNLGEANAKNFYTITGNYIVVGGPIDSVNGLPIEISYYASVPPFVEEDTWLYTKYERLYMAATLVSASAFGVEDQRAVLWETEATNRINALNVEHLRARNSGSRLATKRTGFG